VVADQASASNAALLRIDIKRRDPLTGKIGSPLTALAGGIIPARKPAGPAVSAGLDLPDIEPADVTASRLIPADRHPRRPGSVPSGRTIPAAPAARNRTTSMTGYNPAGHHDDPILTAIRQAYQRKRQAEQDLRTLIAYAREFTRPRPYRLVDLAQAAGMSISGVRIMYDDRDGKRVAELLHQAAAPTADRDA
jgi:hypothetical protein